MNSTMCYRLCLALGISLTLSSACTAGLEVPEDTPEVFILDGLIAQYGAEFPCYKEGVSQHEKLCTQALVANVELLPQMPLVQVQLEPFAIDKYEVSNRQYKHCVSVGGCKEPLFTDSWSQGNGYYYDEDFNEYPVHQVTAEMASAYCAFRGRRLPSDVEWQRVAQGSPVLRDTLRTYPAEGINGLSDCVSTTLDENTIGGTACAGTTDLAPVSQASGDYVDEGYDKDLNPGRIFNLFSNVSEFTSGDYAIDATCKEPLPELDVTGPGGGAFDNFVDCISCLECKGYGEDDTTACKQECKTCEACGGTSALGAPYRPDGYPEGPLDCHIDCWGETRESPRCVRWSAEDMPLSATAVSNKETGFVSVRGGHVGLVAQNNIATCRFRADYRAKAIRKDGSAANQNNATDKGVGFRCARSLTGDELTALMAHSSASMFDHLNAMLDVVEVADFFHPIFSVDLSEESSSADSEDDAGAESGDAESSEGEPEGPAEE
mgnify:CR=1 FL=1